MTTLSGKTILITGASRGIGAAAARICAGLGARVIAHASGKGEAIQALAKELNLEPAQIALEDLSVAGAGARLVATAIKNNGHLDAIVNNAGIYLSTPLKDAAAWDQGWVKTLAVNVQAPADICRAAVTHFRAKGGGRIINLTSRAAYRGDGEDFAGYAASKAAINAITKTLARALSGENILVYAIAPGWVETRMAPQDIEARKGAIKEIPIGRVAQPEEVGEMIAFLLSDVCPSATGSTFDINGASYVR